MRYQPLTIGGRTGVSGVDECEDPCIGLCIIGEDGRCQGCGRTEEEIYGAPPAGDAGGAGG